MAKAGTAFWPRKSTTKGTALQLSPSQAGLAVDQPIEMVSQERAADSAVHQRRAFFEAMIRSNSDTFVSVRAHPWHYWA